jgi:FkbM family methyltransferase
MVKFSKIIKDWQRFISSLKAVRFSDATFLTVCKIINRKRLRSVVIENETINVRSATPDILVAARCLSGKEYGFIEASDPLVIVDAGANIGASSIFFSRRYPGAKVFALEPERENYELLAFNTCSHTNVIPISAALWYKREVRLIQDRLTGPWGYTISSSPNKLRSIGQKVQCITVSDLLKEYYIDSIDILKLDIEGAEREVLEHSDAWIDKVKVIVAELHDRICVGCDRAFYLATQSFNRFQKNGEKVIAYKD